jgi:repressor LexA
MMKSRGYSQLKLAKKAQISQSGLSTIINGGSSPSTVTLQAIAAALECSVAELMGETATGFVQIRTAAVPIVGDIACGVPITAEQNISGYADLPDGIHADFALRCKGDSMIPTLRDGDLVLIRQQPEVEPGQIAAVNVNGETTLKHVYPQPNGLLLTADNANFPPIFVPNEPDGEIIIHGLAVGYTRIFD